MAVNETIKNGVYRVWNAATSMWDRYAIWTKANRVQFDDNNYAETKLGAINGITDSLSSTASDVAASAAAVNELSRNIGGLTFSQDTEGNWGYKPSGADSVIPFKSLSKSFDEIAELLTGSSTENIVSETIAGKSQNAFYSGNTGGSGTKTLSYDSGYVDAYKNEDGKVYLLKSITFTLTCNAMAAYPWSNDKANSSITANLIDADGVNAGTKSCSVSNNTSEGWKDVSSSVDVEFLCSTYCLNKKQVKIIASGSAFAQNGGGTDAHQAKSSCTIGTLTLNYVELK